MKRALIAGAALIALLVVLAFAVGRHLVERHVAPAGAPSAAPSTTDTSAATGPAAGEAHRAFLYGRVTSTAGVVHEGRLRFGFGGSEEALWTDYFNGAKEGNPWADLVPRERLPKRTQPIGIFGFEIGERETTIDLERLFMARLGDLTRIEASGSEVWVTLKSGTLVTLDRFSFGDFDDGVRVWDRQRGIVDLPPRRIRSIDLLPTAELGAAPRPLFGTVHARQGEVDVHFTGLVQWNREKGLASDSLVVRTETGDVTLRFDTLRSIARRPDEGVTVTPLDGRATTFIAIDDGPLGHRGVYVDDPRYGRVLVSWDAFVRLELGAAGDDHGPGYTDFPPGRRLRGSVTTRSGEELAGGLVYDLDESETTETLDAPFRGVDYTIPFGLLAAILLPAEGGRGDGHATVTLHGGEALRLELAGDLGEDNAGVLVFTEEAQPPRYVTWTEVARLAFDRPAAMVPAASPQHDGP